MLDNSSEVTGKKKGRQTGKHTQRIGSHTPFYVYFVVYRQPANWPEEKTSCRYKVTGDLTQFLKIICMFVLIMSLVLDCLTYKDGSNYLITATIHWCTDIYAPAPTLPLHWICYSLVQVLGNKPELPEGGDDDDELADITNRRSAKLYMVSYLFTYN